MEENQTPKKRNYERYLEGETWSPSETYSQNSNTYAYGQSAAGDMQQVDSPYAAPEETSGSYYAQDNYPAQGSYTSSASSVSSGAAYQGLEEPVSMGEWALCIFLNCIPCVGLIMMFVWAFSKDTKKSKSNFFKVQLIFMGIILALYILLVLFVIGMASIIG